MTNKAFSLSIVIPILNEQDGLQELIKQVSLVLDGVEGGPHELIFIDDGSTDASLAIIEKASTSDNRIQALSLSRNFGHQAAISAGLDYTTGDAVVVMDGDLQDSPQAILRFLEFYHKGYDVVYAHRFKRKENWLLRGAYFLFYRLLALLSDIPIPLDTGDFSLMSRRVVNALIALPERTRFLRGLRSWVGFKQIGIDVERGPRFAGEAKYTTVKLLKLALDGIFAFSSIPLRFASFIGGLAIFVSFLYAMYALWAKIMAIESPAGFTALIFAIVFLSGVQLLFLGIIGEFLGRVFQETKQRPLYIVSRAIGKKNG
jgi:dolichol-phosphate mannosyltransferase